MLGMVCTFSTKSYTGGGGGGVVLKNFDRGVLRRFSNPDPI